MRPPLAFHIYAVSRVAPLAVSGSAGDAGIALGAVVVSVALLAWSATTSRAAWLLSLAFDVVGAVVGLATFDLAVLGYGVLGVVLLTSTPLRRWVWNR